MSMYKYEFATLFLVATLLCLHCLVPTIAHET